MDPVETTTAPPPEESAERFKRIGCTALTVILMFMLFCSLIYFITGLSAMFVRFYQTMF